MEKNKLIIEDGTHEKIDGQKLFSEWDLLCEDSLRKDKDFLINSVKNKSEYKRMEEILRMSEEDLGTVKTCMEIFLFIYSFICTCVFFLLSLS